MYARIVKTQETLFFGLSSPGSRFVKGGLRVSRLVGPYHRGPTRVISGKGLDARFRRSKAWTGDPNDPALLDAIMHLEADFAKGTSNGSTASTLRREDLKLICFEYVSN